MTMLWIIRACNHYESYSITAAYESEQEANADCARYTAYHNTKVGPDTNLDGAEWEAEMDRYDAWRALHPAGMDHSYCDEFDVQSITLKRCSDSTQAEA